MQSIFKKRIKNLIILIIAYECLLSAPVIKCEDFTFSDDDISEDYRSTETSSGSTPNNIFSRFDAEDDDEYPMETQNAQCTITAGEVRASAQASTSKKLEGICGTKELKRSFEQLESRLLKELYEMKLMITQLQFPRINIIPNYLNSAMQQGDINPNKISPDLRPPTLSNYNFAQKTTTTTTTTARPPSSGGGGEAIFFPSGEVGNRFHEKDDGPPGQGLQMKNMESPRPTNKPHTGPRDFEVHRFNNTIISSDDTQIFTYFWVIEHLSEKIQSNVMEIKSPIFTISGLHLRIRVQMNYLNRDMIFMKLESVPHDVVLREKSPNIILKRGDMFKEIETQKVFRHKIIILDQDNTSSQADMISQEFLNTNAGFMLPTTALTSSSYVKDDAILIKVIIYL